MKRGLLLFSLFFLGNVLAVSGVSPGSYDVNFEPDYEGNFTFDFIFDNGDSSVIEVNGDLSKYVFLDKKRIFGAGVVTARLILPSYIDEPGVHQIRVAAREISSGGTGVGISSEAVGIINVVVPYPWKYVESRLVVPNFDKGDYVQGKLITINRGNESVEIKPQVQVFYNGTNKEIFELDDAILFPFEKKEFVFLFNSSDYFFGKYWAVSLVDYGGEEYSRNETSFRVGEDSLRILNYTSVLKKGNFEKFDIFVESLSSYKVENIYGELSFSDNFFTSNSKSLLPFETEKLELFVDTRGAGGELPSRVAVYFNGKQVYEDFLLKIDDYLLEFYCFLFLLFLIFLISFIRFRSKFK